MKKYIFSVCALALAAFASSCSDFLDEDPKGQLAQDNFFTSQSDLDMAVNALYRQVCNTSTNTNAGTVSWMGDDMTTNPGSNKQHFAQMVKWTVADDSKGTTNLWKVWYTVIKAANYIILNADKTPVSTSEINIAKGQAYYWRAVAYFSLVRPFGPIPMNLDNTIDTEVAPSSVAEVYAQIEKDLLEAKGCLPNSYSATPRQWEGVACWITAQAAEATLASVYLTEAGWPLNQGTATYKKAADAAWDVIEHFGPLGTNEFDILSNYSEVYSLSNNYNKETVVGINMSNDFTWSQDCEMGVSNIFESQGGWGDAWATYSYWKKFPEGARKEATFMPKIMILVGGNKGKLVNFYDKDESGNYYVAEHHPCYQIFCASKDGKGDFDYTYNNVDLTAGNACTSQRIRLVRYSEVLLWYAEATARSGSVTQQALDCLNEVRERAGEEKIATVNTLSATEFADLCADEHGYEVAGYFTSLNTHRFDVQRLGKMQELYNQRKSDYETGVEVAPGVVMKEDMGPEVSYSESLIYAPYNNVDAALNPNLK